jgi:hypothetical protein
MQVEMGILNQLKRFNYNFLKTYVLSARRYQS